MRIARALSLDLKKKVRTEIERIGGQIRTEEPVDPEYILWNNIGYSNHSRNLRRIFSLFIAIAIIASSVFLIIYFKE